MSDQRVFDIIRKTRPMLMPYWGKIEHRQKDMQQGDDVAQATVTELDLAIEGYLRDELAQIDPDASFAGEEFGGSRDTKRFWLCDPIDGTVHFVRGLPFCSVMLALIEDGRVNFSIVYDFVNDHLYHARRGSGAFCNDEPIHVSDRAFDGGYVVFESRIDKDSNMKLLQQIRHRANVMESVTSGYEFALVASGKLEARICFDAYGKDYDFAPGSLLVEEAGGIVRNIESDTYDFRNLNFIAANPRVFETLTAGPDALFPSVQGQAQ